MWNRSYYLHFDSALTFVFVSHELRYDNHHHKPIAISSRKHATIHTMTRSGWSLEDRRGAAVDWFSRRVLSHRMSITMETDFCLEALAEALAKQAGRRFSTPIKAASSPARRSPAC
jgi:transposase InsO family protein